LPGVASASDFDLRNNIIFSFGNVGVEFYVRASTFTPGRHLAEEKKMKDGVGGLEQEGG
jgi:hypothetical protein